MKSTYTKTENIIFFITAFMLFLAILDLPYGYYTFLRISVTLSSIYLLVIRKSELFIIGVIIAILFNPIFPIYLAKGIWIIVDILVGAFFFIYWILNKKIEN